MILVCIWFFLFEIFVKKDDLLFAVSIWYTDKTACVETSKPKVTKKQSKHQHSFINVHW